MIRIISRRVFRFYNPSQKLVSQAMTPDGQVYQELAIPASMTLGKENMTAELFFDTIPGEPQLAPDWIKAETKDRVNINTFRNAVKEGTLMEVAVVSDAPGPLETARPAGAPERIAVAPLPGQALEFPVVDAANLTGDDDDADAAAPARPLAGGRIAANKTRNQSARS